MELVHGVPITEYCDKNKLSTQQRLELFIPVCQAIQHAHQKGIIHRDIKPSNVMVTLHDGVPVPKVIDFGVAKATNQRLTEKTLFTNYAQIIGTPAYMSPEQAEMSGLDIDTRSDIYSLGVLLYELLTGTTPFDAKELLSKGYAEMQRIIAEQEPVKPSTRMSTLTDEQLTVVAKNRNVEESALRKVLQGDLDWIVMKCLEKDRTRRYETSNGLAADLRRHLSNELISARPPTTAYLLRKLIRRNRAAFATAAVVAASLIIGLGGSAWKTHEARAANRLAEQARVEALASARAALEAQVKAEHEQTRAEASELKAQSRAYAAEMNVAFQALKGRNLGRARELLERQLGRSDHDMRGFEWRYLWQLCRPNALESLNHYGTAFDTGDLAFSPDGKLLAYGSTNVVIRDVASHEVVTTLPCQVNALAFSPDAKVLVSGCDSEIILWSTRNWKKMRTLPGANRAAAFSPDGNWLIITTRRDYGYQVWNTKTWEQEQTCLIEPSFLMWPNAVAFSPDGNRVVMQADRESHYSFRLCQLPSLQLVSGFGNRSDFLCAAYAPDGRHLLAGYADGSLEKWDLERKVVVGSAREHLGFLTAIRVAPDGKTFVTSSSDRTLQVWETETLKPLSPLQGHVGEIWSVALSPDGHFVASLSYDGTVKFWDAWTRHDPPQLAGAGERGFGFSSDNKLLIAGTPEGVMCWDLATLTTNWIPLAAETPGTAREVSTIDVHGTEPFVAVGRNDGRVEVWNLQTRSRQTTWQVQTNKVRCIAFSPDGQFLATDAGAAVALLEVSTGREKMRVMGRGRRIKCLAFSPDGRFLAAGWEQWQSLLVWDVTHAAPSLELLVPWDSVASVAFAPDSRQLVASADSANLAAVWEIPSGKQLTTLQGHVQGTYGVGFSPDGRTIATASNDQTVKLWNLETSQEMLTLPLGSYAGGLKFSSDGRYLAVGSWWVNPTIRLWHAPSWEEIGALESKEKAQSK